MNSLGLLGVSVGLAGMFYAMIHRLMEPGDDFSTIREILVDDGNAEGDGDAE